MGHDRIAAKDRRVKTVFMFGIAGALFAVAFAAETAVHRLPTASSIFPQGARPGAIVEAEIIGEFLDRAQQAIFVDDAISATITESSPMRLKLRLTVSERARFGPHFL